MYSRTDYNKVTQDDRKHIQDYNNTVELQDRKCEQCGQVMGAEWLTGAVCLKCCRSNHRKAIHR